MGLVLNKYKNKSTLSLLTGMVKMAMATFSSRILGLVREQTIAHYFGASGLTDAFLVAYRIPNLLRDMFAEGAFSSAFVPTFISAKLESDKNARELLWTMVILLSIITIIIGLCIYFFAPQLISLFAPEFTHNSEKYHHAVNLTKILSPFLWTISLAALFMGALNAYKIFFLPSFAPAVFNASTILILYFCYPKKIELLGYAAMIGAFAQVLIQYPSLHKISLTPIWPKKFFTDSVKKIFILLGPGLIGLAATQINLLISTILASSIEGAVSWLNFAFRLFQFPIGILGVSLASSNLVHFAQSWKSKDVQKQKEGISLLGIGLQTSYELMAPCAVFLIWFAKPIIHLVYQGGHFSPFDTVQTSQVLKLYAWGLIFYGPYKILVPTFYTLGKERIPVYCAMAGIFCNILFCTSLTKVYGHEILALGAGLSILVNTLGLFIVLKKHLELPMGYFFGRSQVYLILALSISILITKFVKVSSFVLLATNPSKWDCFLEISAFGFIFFLFYGAILFSLKRFGK